MENRPVSQAMGRVGEVIIRAWQTAHKMKAQRGVLASEKKEVPMIRNLDDMSNSSL
ncbi:MAG: hypothetical protein MGG11_18875 [Trichodesmium sp. MAG_R03]|nr:hypothetical protein [Trichodesmium sp. MAG_R03]